MLKHIFISHAGEDSDVAERLAGDLRNAGHETRIDKQELKLGDDLIQWINKSVSDAHTVVILFSKHTCKAKFQEREISSSLWSEIEQSGGRCVVIKLDDSPLPPVLGSKVFAQLAPDLSNYLEVFEELCNAIMPSPTASSIVAEALQKGTPNPFWRVRAEFFEQELPRLLAETFSPPDAMKMGALEAMKPCLIEGPRGTGKSMLLLSLRARNLASRKSASKDITQLFGFYLKLSPGAVCNAGVSAAPDSDLQWLQGIDLVQVTDAFSQEMVTCLLESLFAEIAFCIEQKYISCDADAQKGLAEDVYRVITGTPEGAPGTIDELMWWFGSVHSRLAEFTRRKFIYRENVSVPIATLDIVMFKRVVKRVKDCIQRLSNTVFVALCDEYENLFPFQQKVINGFVKAGPPDFSVKIAKKLGSSQTSATTTAEVLQEIHDYNRVPLVYDVEDRQQLSAYCRLLEHMTSNTLRCAGLVYEDMAKLIPSANDLEVEGQQWVAQVAKLGKLTCEGFGQLPEEKQRNLKVYYGEAAIYRVLYGRKGRQRDKRFSGFQDLAFLSSGVIRYFQEFLGVAFHLQYGQRDPGRELLAFPYEAQTEAVHIVSRHYLTTLSRNVPSYGERLKYYIMDIGDCLREKLLRHTSEPEGGRFTIVNPEFLERPQFADLRKAINLGIREGLFQTGEGRPAFRPKHGVDPQPTEFNISRIYAPVLQISARLRWRTNISCQDLLELWTPESRADAKKKFMKKMRTFRPTNQQTLCFPAGEES